MTLQRVRKAVLGSYNDRPSTIESNGVAARRDCLHGHAWRLGVVVGVPGHVGYARRLPFGRETFKVRVAYQRRMPIGPESQAPNDSFDGCSLPFLLS